MKKITVVIPNWNGEKYLETCFRSLFSDTSADFDVLMIDNASEDGSVAYVKEHFPKVRILVMEKNLGFAGGVNVGIRNTETPYVLLLNNDVEVAPGFTGGLLAAIEKDPKIFSVSAKMVNFRERELLDDCGDLYTIFGFQAQIGVGQPVNDPAYEKPRQVFSACGGAALFRRRVFDEIGLFDEAHFAYLEDIDVGFRGNIYGYKNVYEPSAVVYHIGSAASGATKYSDFKVRISARNALYVPYKNMPLVMRGINALPLFLGRKIKQRFFRSLGFGEAYEAGIREGKEKRPGLKRVPFSPAHLGAYFRIQWMLIRFTFLYAGEYLKRRKRKAAGAA